LVKKPGALLFQMFETPTRWGRFYHRWLLVLKQDL